VRVSAILDGDGGLRITYGSGDSASVGAPRHLVYNMLCDVSAPPDAPPDTLVAPSGGTYQVTWRTPHACGQPAAASHCTAAAAPVPDKEMLAYVQKEVGALVCYNMATMDGSQGCPQFHVPGADVWESQVPQSEAALDAATEQWAASIAAFGGKYATLVAKHVCGFAIWPTNASLPAGGARARPFRYAYHSSQDVVGSFLKACTRHGIGLGIYYSVNANEYLNYHNGVRDPSTLQPGQEQVSAEEYAELALQQLEELWTRYGELAEASTSPPPPHPPPSTTLPSLQIW